MSGDTRGWTNKIKKIKFKEVEQQVINHTDLRKTLTDWNEMNGENILEETRDGHEKSASLVETLEYSPEDYTSK